VLCKSSARERLGLWETIKINTQQTLILRDTITVHDLYIRPMRFASAFARPARTATPLCTQWRKQLYTTQHRFRNEASIPFTRFVNNQCITKKGK
jgi:hypothetical protein